MYNTDEVLVFAAATAVRTGARIKKEILDAWRTPGAADAGALALSQYAAGGLGLATTVLAARILGPRDYGIAALVLAYPSLVGSIAAVKTSTVTVRYISAFHEEGRTREIASVCRLGYRIDALAALAGLALVASTNEWVGRHLLQNPGPFWAGVVYSALLVIASVSGTSWAVLVSLRRFRAVSLLQFAEGSLKFALIVAALVAGFGIAGMVLATGLSAALGSLLMTAAAWRVARREGVRLKGAGKVVTIPRSEISILFGWNYLTMTFGGLLAQVPVLLLGRLKGPQEAGYLRLSTGIVSAASYLEGALSKVAYPLVSRIRGADETERLQNLIRRWTYQRGLPAGLIMLGAVPLIPFVVPLAFGARFTPASEGVQIMLVGAAVSATFFYVHAVYYAAGKVGLWAKAYGTYVLLTISIAWVGIRSFGFLGLAVVTGVSQAAFNIAMALPLFSSRALKRTR